MFGFRVIFVVVDVIVSFARLLNNVNRNYSWFRVWFFGVLKVFPQDERILIRNHKIPAQNGRSMKSNQLHDEDIRCTRTDRYQAAAHSMFESNLFGDKQTKISKQEKY